MKKQWYVIISIMLLTWSCGDAYDPSKNLSQGQYDAYVKQLAPYVNKKPDEISYQDRFNKAVEIFYQNVVGKSEGKIPHYLKNDTVHFFSYQYKDLSSLFEHYRGLGGYFKTNEKDSVIFVNLLYHTPRLTKDEMNERGRVLFMEMISKGSVDRYVGNRDFIHTPNADFYYNVKENRWDYTENSSWKFLQEERERYEDKKDSLLN